MTEIIMTLLSGVGTLLSYGFWSVMTVVVVGAVIAFLTKPKDETFSPYFKKRIASSSHPRESTSLGQELLKTGLSFVVEKTSATEFQDFILFKMVNVTAINGSRVQFFGAFQHWFLIDDLSSQHPPQLRDWRH